MAIDRRQAESQHVINNRLTARDGSDSICNDCDKHEKCTEMCRSRIIQFRCRLLENSIEDGELVKAGDAAKVAKHNATIKHLIDALYDLISDEK